MNRRGGALVTVLLLLLVLTALAHGGLAVASAELRSARAAAAAVRLRLGERAALGAAGSAVATDTLPGLVVGGSAELGRDVRLRRVGRELHLLELRRRRTLVWALDPAARVVGSEGTVAYGGEIFADPATITASEFWRVLPGEAPACAPHLAALDSVAPLAWAPVADVRISAQGEEGSALGRLGVVFLRERLPETATGERTLAPSLRVGVCDLSDPDNWGEPTRPAAPCGAHLRAAGADGSVVLRGGVGAGLLVVLGDLALEEGAVFSGLVVVAGDLRVTGGSRLDGMARVAGDVTVDDGGGIGGRACPVLRALVIDPSLRRPLPLDEPSFLHGHH